MVQTGLRHGPLISVVPMVHAVRHRRTNSHVHVTKTLELLILTACSVSVEISSQEIRVAGAATAGEEWGSGCRHCFIP